MKPSSLLLSIASIATLLVSEEASAQYRLRADAFYAGGDPASGFIMLQGEARAPAWLEAEAAVWIGTGDHPADVLIASVRAHDPDGRGELRAGRMLVSMGAIRPVHLDGGWLTVRAPWGTSVSAFGGVPVVPEGPRDYTWAAGGRLAQRIGKSASVGLSYLQMRSVGAIDFEEIGVDAAAAPARFIDGAISGAVDAVRLGLSDGRVSVGLRPTSAIRLELYALHRAPSHLLPATSLFAALGDIPSTRGGASMLLRAAPRLDVTLDGAGESLGGAPGFYLTARSTLRLDDRGDGAIGLELRRMGAPGASWIGARATARLPLSRLLAASTELEIVRPDDPRGRGAVWPWGLVALRLRPEPSWELSAAIEANASPTSLAQVTGLARISRALGSK